MRMDPIMRIVIIYKFIHFLLLCILCNYLRHFYSVDSLVDAMNFVGFDYRVPDFDTMMAVVEIVHCEKLVIGLVVD